MVYGAKRPGRHSGCKPFQAGCSPGTGICNFRMLRLVCDGSEQPKQKRGKRELRTEVMAQRVSCIADHAGNMGCFYGGPPCGAYLQLFSKNVPILVSAGNAPA